jgi:hypothetical protein
MEKDDTIARTVIALFEFEDEANRAADNLVGEGFSRDSINIIVGHDLSHPEDYVEAKDDAGGKIVGSVGKGLAVGGGVGVLAGGLSSLLLPGVGPFIFAGALATMLTGAGLGASVGGVMATLMQAGVDESNARLFESALRHGGVVLALRTDEANARRAVVLLERSGALDMDKHKALPGDRGEDKVEGATGSRRSDTGRDHSSPQ